MTIPYDDIILSPKEIAEIEKLLIPVSDLVLKKLNTSFAGIRQYPMQHKVYRIEYTKEALKYLLKMPTDIGEDMRSAFYRLAQGVPTNLDIRRLQGFGTPTYGLRRGSYRAIFRYDEDTIVIVVLKIGPRGDVYK